MVLECHVLSSADVHVLVGMAHLNYTLACTLFSSGGVTGRIGQLHSLLIHAGVLSVGWGNHEQWLIQGGVS